MLNWNLVIHIYADYILFISGTVHSHYKYISPLNSPKVPPELEILYQKLLL